MVTDPGQVQESAKSEAAVAAQRSAVVVRPLVDRDECQDASALLARLWGTESCSAPLTGDVLVSLSHAGSCLLGAFATSGQLVGVVVGVAGAPGSEQLYSMIAGVDPRWSGRGVGVALKLAQRAWALKSTATHMVWTFDPLIKRNARFNLVRLGARATGYIADFYPPMHDAINAQDRPDRLVIDWDLVDPVPTRPASSTGTVVLAAGEHGGPVRHELVTGDWLVGVPEDVEKLRVTEPGVAARWRWEMREVMQPGYDEGRRITGFTEDAFYVVGWSA